MTFERILPLLVALFAAAGCDTAGHHHADGDHAHEPAVVAGDGNETHAHDGDAHVHDDAHVNDPEHAHDHDHGDPASHDHTHDDAAHEHENADAHAHPSGEADAHDREHAHETSGDVHDHGHEHGHEEAWAITAWGDHFEIFAEADPLIAGEVSTSHTHVTLLRDFSPVRDGLVEVVLRREGSEAVFGEEVPVRDGIFDVAIRPQTVGVHELLFRIQVAGRREEIAAGRVRVGTEETPGGLERGAREPDGEIIPLLKEQQWKSAFRTTWAEEGELHLVVRAPGFVRPMAGGEVVLSAPMTAIVGGAPWPHVGREVVAGERLFALTPHVASDRSLADLEALETEKRAALALAEERLARLESLVPVQAASQAEVEAARATVTSLRAQHEAARTDLRTARAGRAGGAAGGESVPIASPLAGTIATVQVRPGEVVTAGQVLGRVVREEPYWVEVFLRPAHVIKLADGAGLALRGAGMSEPVSIPPSHARLVSRSPEVSSANGTLTCVFEVSGAPPAPLGSAVEVEVALPETRSGVIVPSSAIVDDAGTPVVYVQIDGEGFVRREVDLVVREGSRLIVRGVAAGERVVSVGGPVIRRATLVSSGVGHGHVH